jgi:anti-sigma-K factor RskA
VEAKDIIASGLLDLYAAGLCSEEESMEVSYWLQQSPEVADAYATIQDGLERYALAHAMVPAAAVKEKIWANLPEEVSVNQITPVKQPSNSVIPMYWKWLAAASILLLIGSGILNLLLYRHVQNLAIVNELTCRELADNREGLNNLQADLQVMQNRYTEAVKLNGVNTTPKATAKVYWMKNTGELYLDPANLPDAPVGSQYQLWAIVDGKPVDAGLIVTTPKGNTYRIQKMKTFGRAQAFAITLEKEGGSLVPSLEKMIVMGKL